MARRPVEWIGRAFNSIAFPTVAGQELDFPIVDADDSGPNDFSFEHYTRPTIVRIVGQLTIQMNQTGTSVDNYGLRYMVGLICSDEDKPAERLDEEIGHSWLWIGYGTLIRPQVVIRIPDNAGASLQVNSNFFGKPLGEHTLDIRAMRKIPRDCELRVVIHTKTITGTVLPHISGFVRVLVKE